MAATRQGHGYLEALGGVRLHYRAWEATHPRAALLVLHGLADHSGRYEELGQTMASLGISSYVPDQRGHGSSEGRRGHVGRFDVFLQDTDRLRREVQGLVDPSCPLFLLGQGMGGLIALRYLEEYGPLFRGGILLAPWLGGAPLPRWKAGLAGMLSRALPALPLRVGIRPEQLTHDEQLARAYADDPLVYDVITPRLSVEAAAAAQLALQRADRLATPLLVLLPGADRLNDALDGAALLRSLPVPELTVSVLPGLYHELLSELERASILARIRDWISERLP
jgi:lysophospholipase